MAMDAKGNDFVIVSHVKGHADETHIALGQATLQEAEANDQADIRAVKGAKEHAISEIVIENYKIKGQQAKIMQRMLIAIYKERRKQYMLQKLEMLRQADEETHDDYNPWAQDEERSLNQRTNRNLGKPCWTRRGSSQGMAGKSPPSAALVAGDGPSLSSLRTSTKCKRMGT